MRPIDRFLAAAYRRWGTRYLIAYPLIITLYIWASASTGLALTGRVQGEDESSVVGVVLGGCVAIAAGMSVLCWLLRTEFGVLRAWVNGPRTAETARRALAVVLELPAYGMRRAAAVGLVVAFSYAPLVFATFDVDPVAAVLLGIAAIALTLGIGGVLAIVVFELMRRPLMRELSEVLAEHERPPASFPMLATRVRGAIPLICFGTGLVAVLYAAPDASSRDLMIDIGVVFALTVLVAFTLSYLLSESVLGPTHELVQLTDRIRDGELGGRAIVLSGDELGQLTYDFNEAVQELLESRARVVAAGDAARRRVERDLHDGAQQRLVMLRLKLGVLGRELGDARVADLQAELEAALDDLRELAHGIYPVALESEGLRGALEDAARRCSIPTTVNCDGAGRYAPELETAIFFCCLEALQNAAKHAGGDAVARIALAAGDGALTFEVTDDGPGFDPTSNGAGLQNMRDRIGALGGELHIDSAPGAGTTVRGRVPVEV